MMQGRAAGGTTSNGVSGGLELRSSADRLSLAIFPPPIGTHNGTSLRLVVKGKEAVAVPRSSDAGCVGLFACYSVPMPATQPPRVTIKKLRDAAYPARRLVLSNVTGHVFEPSLAEWQAGAAVWSVSLQQPSRPPAPAGTDVRLRINYTGDAARFIANGHTVLHDNWFTGYESLGADTKRLFCALFSTVAMKTIYFPRQARDKHRENVEKKTFCFCRENGGRPVLHRR